MVRWVLWNVLSSTLSDFMTAPSSQPTVRLGGEVWTFLILYSDIVEIINFFL